MQAHLLQVLPLPNNPVEREWYVVRVPSKQLPQVALAFEKFLCEEGQVQIDQHIHQLRLEQSTPQPSRDAARIDVAVSDGSAV